MNPRKVIVFGSSNAGKTSMINMLSNQNYPVNNSATGCTFKTVTIPPIEKGGVIYQFFDTAGLNETDRGTVNSKAAVQNIIDLLKSCRGGINLLIYVMRIGTITQTEKANYDMFCRVITNQKVPVICVITGCENEDPMSRWVTNNQRFFDNNEMQFNGIVGTCFAKGGRFEDAYRPLREESTALVWNAILDSCAREPVDFIGQSGGIFAALKRIWNSFCEYIGKKPWKWVNEQVKEMLIRLGFGGDEADKIAEQY